MRNAGSAVTLPAFLSVVRLWYSALSPPCAWVICGILPLMLSGAGAGRAGRGVTWVMNETFYETAHS